MSHAVHPEMAPILAQMLAAQLPDLTKMPPAEARVLFERNATVWNTPLPEMEMRDTRMGGVQARVLQPGARGGVIVFAHGGGWVFGSPDSHHRSARLLAQATGMEVVLPDYRLAPEHACPAAIDDVLAVVGAIGRDRPLVLFGDSAGANIALAAALAGAPAAMLSLVYGCFGPVFDTASHRECGDGKFGLTTERMRWFWGNWQGSTNDPRAAPLNAKLEGLPPVHLLAAGLDCLRDDSILLAGRLASAGVPLRLDIIPGVIHGFLQMTSRLGPARDAVAMLAAEIKRTVATEKQP
jgi:acetyl esterase